MIIDTGKRYKRYLKTIFFENYGIPKIFAEKISKNVIRKYLPENPVIVDCGAYDGTDSVGLAKNAGSQVHAFEPIDDIFTVLKQRTSEYKNIFCYQVALSDQDGVQVFFVSEGNSNASSSLLQPKDHLQDHPNTYFKNQISVNTLTLDSWAKKYSIERVDMLWLDMQGYEINMLKASRHILQTVKVIHSEVSTKETYEGVVLYPEYKHYLENMGFEVILEAIPRGWDMGNVLFVRK